MKVKDLTSRLSMLLISLDKSTLSRHSQPIKRVALSLSFSNKSRLTRPQLPPVSQSPYQIPPLQENGSKPRSHESHFLNLTSRTLSRSNSPKRTDLVTFGLRSFIINRRTTEIERSKSFRNWDWILWKIWMWEKEKKKKELTEKREKRKRKDFNKEGTRLT